MAASYPGAIKNFLELEDGVDDVLAQHANERGEEITALQTLIGVLYSGQSYSESLKNLLKNYRQGCMLRYLSTAEIDIEAGEIAIYDASGNIRWRRNASDLTVDWTDIDTGAEAAETTYYVYAVADASGTEFTALISTNSATPTGATFYRLIGSFYNDASSNIDEDSIVKSTNIAIVTGTIAHGATISLPAGFAEVNCRWMVSPAAVEGEEHNDPSQNYALSCSADGTRVVTCQWTDSKNNTIAGTANYIIIGVK